MYTTRYKNEKFLTLIKRESTPVNGLFWKLKFASKPLYIPIGIATFRNLFSLVNLLNPETLLNY